MLTETGGAIARKVQLHDSHRGQGREARDGQEVVPALEIRNEVS